MDGGSQPGVNAVPAVLYGHHASGPAAGNNGNGLAGVAAQRKQKAVELLVIGVDALDDVLTAEGRVVQIHTITCVGLILVTIG